MTRHTSFWDRRRAAVAKEAEAETRVALAREEAAAQAELAECSDAELLERFNLPDPDGLKRGDDFTAFMVKAIPDHLRRRALRKLWVSDPVLACLDDLVDYADDYTQASAVTKFSTSYQVGKGLRRHVEELARQAQAKQEDAPEVSDEQPEALVFAEEAETTDTAATSVDEPTVEAAVIESETEISDEPIRPAPRRMTFSYGEQGA